jgi:hypothetical protein
MLIEDQLEDINEDDDFLSEDKEMTNWMKSVDNRLNDIETENTAFKTKNIKLNGKIKDLKKDNTELKKNDSTQNERIDSLETVTAKPFILNICTQILKHISGVKFETSTKSHYFSRNKKDEKLSRLISYVKNKYKTKDFCRRADKCIHERNEIFHPSSFDLLRDDAQDALKLIAKSPSLQQQLRFERIVLEIVNDQEMINAFFTVCAKY